MILRRASSESGAITTFGAGSLYSESASFGPGSFVVTFGSRLARCSQFITADREFPVAIPAASCVAPASRSAFQMARL